MFLAFAEKVPKDLPMSRIIQLETSETIFLHICVAIILTYLTPLLGLSFGEIWTTNLLPSGGGGGATQ